VVRRWNHYPRGSLRRGRAKKNNPTNEPADHALGRSQGGFSTKIHVKADGEGHVIGFTLTPGQTHESTQFQTLMEAGPLMGSQGLASGKGAAKDKGQANWPDAVGGDKAYSSNGIRDWCDHRDILPVIPTRTNEQRREDFDKDRYRERNIIERTIGWLKECRRVLTRFEKYAVHYAGMITLAIIQRLLPTG
jgi:transposase